MTVHIRTATQSDRHLLAQLLMTVHNLHVQAMPNRYRPLDANDPVVIEYFEIMLATEGNTIFIAELDDEAVGYISCQVRDIPDNMFVYGLRDLHIDQMSVKETHQRQGIGNALMSHAIDFGKSEDVTRISLGVIPFNQQAIKFYERCGFKFGSHRMLLTIAE